MTRSFGRDVDLLGILIIRMPCVRRDLRSPSDDCSDEDVGVVMSEEEGDRVKSGCPVGEEDTTSGTASGLVL